jgi:serine/threonine-protein kinase
MSPIRCSQGHENVTGSRYCYLCGEKLGSTPQGIFIGQVLGERYRIQRELGQGGFGRTYLAEDLHRFNELCVLKEFAPLVQGDEALQKARELFEREAGVLYRLRHPQIPRFRELFQTHLAGRGKLFLVQDYVVGPTYRYLLEQRCQEGHTFSQAEVLQLLEQLLPVLDYIHGNGVIHRDISPENLILRDADQLPVLIDFGGVKQLAAAASEFAAPGTFSNPVPSPTSTRLGKVGYAPPEQLQAGRAMPHSDLYALGVTALVLLTGKEPPDLLGQEHNWRNRVSLTSPLDTLLEKMLAEHPSDRFQTASEALQTLHGNPPPAHPPTPPPSPPQPPPPTTPPNPTIPILLTLLLLALGGIGWWTSDRWLPPLMTFLTDGEQVEPGAEDNPDFSSEEQTRKAALIARREALGVNSSFLVKITNDTFYNRYPDQQGRTLSTDPEDAEWRQRWDTIADEWLDRFETHLSSVARAGLGSFGNSDQEQWKQRVNQLYVSSRSLNDLTDAYFFHLFPELRDENFINQPVGQVWRGIAFDQVNALEAGEILERVEFAENQFSQQVGGTLSPDEGRVYIAAFNEGQLLRLNLQADPEQAQLSIYLPRPTAARPAILEDSDQFTWAGTLPQSGFYEFTIVAIGDQPVSYQLTLAADNVTTTPTDPEEAEAPEAKD